MQHCSTMSLLPTASNMKTQIGSLPTSPARTLTNCFVSPWKPTKRAALPAATATRLESFGFIEIQLDRGREK